MYGLPIFRRYTPSDAVKPTADDCDNPFGCDKFKPLVLKSSLDLCQMVLNHFSLIISAKKTSLMAWGNTPSYGYTAASSSNSRVPVPCLINWKNGIKKTIIKVYSHGYDNTYFLTDNGELYGTGANTNLLNVGKRTDYTSRFNLITEHVTDFCVSYTNFILYVKSDSKVYGLGLLNNAFGFDLNSPSRKNLLNDYNDDRNYLGVSNALKVFTTSPDGGNSKSFVLLNDGTVYACGTNTNGCLGVNSDDPIIYTWKKVKKSTDNGIVDLDKVTDIITSNFMNRGGASGAGSAWGGATGSGMMCTYFLTSDGNVYTCGTNIYGQLGLGSGVSNSKYAQKTSITNATTITTCAGGASILVTTLDNSVYGWGNNSWGQLGIGTTNSAVYNPTLITSLPKDKIKQVNGGGMYSVVLGAFIVVYNDGSIYSAGYNSTYSLGITNNGVPNGGNITTFTKNEYFGPNPTQIQDPERYPLSITGTITKDSDKMILNTVFLTKNVNTANGLKNENVYVTNGMKVTGTGIPSDTTVLVSDYKTNTIILSNPATQSGTFTYRFDFIIKAYQADLCGYGTEMAQKVVSEDKTLYMSGWDQLVITYNFNWYYHDAWSDVQSGKKVGRPTAFDANFNVP